MKNLHNPMHRARNLRATISLTPSVSMRISLVIVNCDTRGFLYGKCWQYRLQQWHLRALCFYVRSTVRQQDFGLRETCLKTLGWLHCDVIRPLLMSLHLEYCVQPKCICCARWNILLCGIIWASAQRNVDLNWSY